MFFPRNTFAAFAETLGSRESRKIANNTYLVRRDSETIAIKLHATDVITYRADGTVTLQSGGYETVTTKERMNRFGPDGMRIYSIKRQWFVSLAGFETPYVNGMTFDPDHFEETTADYRTDFEATVLEHRRIDNGIKRFVAALTAQRLQEIVEQASRPMGLTGDCLICMVERSDIRDNGRHAASLTSGDTEHLASHIAEDYWHASLIMSALYWAGYRDFQMGSVIRMPSIVNRTMRRYLRARLISSPNVSQVVEA